MGPNRTETKDKDSIFFTTEFRVGRYFGELLFETKNKYPEFRLFKSICFLDRVAFKYLNLMSFRFMITVLPLIIPAGIINLLPFFLRELLEGGNY